jgi:hypothetical protein
LRGGERREGEGGWRGRIERRNGRQREAEGGRGRQREAEGGRGRMGWTVLEPLPCPMVDHTARGVPYVCHMCAIL